MCKSHPFSSPVHRGKKIDYPIIADPDRELAEKLGMIDPDEKSSTGLPMTCRAVFIIGPDKKLKLQILYPASTGRNFNGTCDETTDSTKTRTLTLDPSCIIH
ncbi:MAG: redoxin domain-containing protein [Pseudomonadota bacterium]